MKTGRGGPGLEQTAICVHSHFWAWAASEQQVLRDMKFALILPLGSRAPAPNPDSWTPED